MFFLGVQRWKWNTTGHQIELQLQRIISLFLYPPENARYASGNVQVQMYCCNLFPRSFKWSTGRCHRQALHINRILQYRVSFWGRIWGWHWIYFSHPELEKGPSHHYMQVVMKSFFVTTGMDCNLRVVGSPASPWQVSENWVVPISKWRGNNIIIKGNRFEILSGHWRSYNSNSFQWNVPRRMLVVILLLCCVACAPEFWFVAELQSQIPGIYWNTKV